MRALIAFFAVLFFPAAAFAQYTDVSEVAFNITESISDLPGLLRAASYLVGIILAVMGIIKLKEHVEDPRGTKINAGAIRLLTGGALFALPHIIDAMRFAITMGRPDALAVNAVSDDQAANLVTGSVNIDTTAGFNNILDNIVVSISDLPGLITGVAYLLGLVLAYSAIIKIKEHVENPEQTKLHEGVVRLLVGGALFSLPTIYEAMYASLVGGGGGGGMSFVASLITAEGGGTLSSSQAGGNDMQCEGAMGLTFGAAICNVVRYTTLIPQFMTAVSYLFGLVLGLWAMLKIRDHVLDPRSTPLWDGVAKLLAGGAFFALPYILDVAAATVTDGMVTATNSGFNENPAGGSCAPAGLDMAMFCLMRDIFGPIHVAVNFFALIAGIVFIMIGISRVMKSAQDGAKGPGGIGTLMTFLTGGVLLSANSILGAFSQTLFGDSMVFTNATLSYSSGLSGDEFKHVHTVISAIVKFMIVVGIISFVRGWFIMRDVAEGSGQASVMAGTTHIIGGALAVNLGPLLNAVQMTLGIDGIGLIFD